MESLLVGKITVLMNYKKGKLIFQNKILHEADAIKSYQYRISSM